MDKVLFSTTWGPMQEQFFNTSPTDVMNQRFSRGCDIFTLGGHLHMNSAHLIAQNIDMPSLFLEYPRREDFEKEVEKGYKYVALTAFHNQVDDLIEMCKLVRAKAPESEIVLGGFGAVGLEVTRTEEELKELCDHLCHGEGTRFFRELLGEDPDRPMFHSHLPKWGYSLPMINLHPEGVTPVVVGSLGCPNACDFCATSEMFAKKRVQLMTPEQVHKEFRRIWREAPDTPQATLLEEDSFQDEDYMRELGRLLREDPEFGLSYYNFYCLASIRSMSEWSFMDMALTGATNVFVGVESKFAGDHGYGKTDGLSTREMFEGLQRVGITPTGAWMIGFDFQNRQNIEEDLQEFISLHPPMQQLARVCPFPATAMWHEMKKAGRIRDDVKWDEISFYGGGGMDPLNFNDHEVMEIIERGYRQLYETHGASIARIADVNMKGYEFCMENRKKNKYLEERAIYHKRAAMTIFPIFKAMEIFAPNNTVRKRMKDLRRDYVRLFGEPSLFIKQTERALIGVSGLAKFLDVVYPLENVLPEAPPKRYLYDKPAPEYPECPYTTEYPHRTWKFKTYRGSTLALRKTLQRVERFSRLYERYRGVEFDEAMERGPFMMFM